MDDQNRKLEENRTRYGFAWWRQIRQGIGFSATLPTPFAQRVSSPWNAFTRSLAYHASGGARRVESSANNNPFWPVGWLLSSVLHTPSSILYYNSHSAFLRMARLFVCPMVGQLKAFRRFVDAIFFPSPLPSPLSTCPVTSPITEISWSVGLTGALVHHRPRPRPPLLSSRGGCERLPEFWIHFDDCSMISRFARWIIDE